MNSAHLLRHDELSVEEGRLVKTAFANRSSYNYVFNLQIVLDSWVSTLIHELVRMYTITKKYYCGAQ